MRSRFLSFVIPVVILALSAGILLRTNQSRIDRLKGEYDLFQAPPLAGMKTSLVNLLLLGQKPVYDDFISIWLLQALVDQRKGKDADGMQRAINSVVHHEPKLESIYMLSCFVMMDDMGRPEACQDITLAGLRAFPQSWRLPMTQGFVEYFKLKRPAQAASFFMMAASRRDSPDYVQKVARKLLTTNEVSEEDLQSSLALLKETGSDEAFRKMLESIASSKAPANQ